MNPGIVGIHQDRSIAYDDNQLLLENITDWILEPSAPPPIAGDTDLDRDVDGADLATVGVNWSPGGYTPDVPEPATMALIAIGGLALVSRKRK